MQEHKDYVKALAFASEARVLVSAGLDNNVYVWDIEK